MWLNCLYLQAPANWARGRDHSRHKIVLGTLKGKTINTVNCQREILDTLPIAKTWVEGADPSSTVQRSPQGHNIRPASRNAEMNRRNVGFSKWRIALLLPRILANLHTKASSVTIRPRWTATCSRRPPPVGGSTPWGMQARGFWAQPLEKVTTTAAGLVPPSSGRYWRQPGDVIFLQQGVNLWVRIDSLLPCRQVGLLGRPCLP